MSRTSRRTRPERGPRPLQHWLEAENGPYARLQAHCRRLQRLQARVRAHLPANLQDHCQVADCRDGRLVLHAASAAHATLLRYRLPDLLQNLRRDGLVDLRAIEIKVRPPPSTPVTKGGEDTTPARRAPVIPLRLTPETAALIASLAAGVEQPELRASLLRLARRARSPGDT